MKITKWEIIANGAEWERKHNYDKELRVFRLHYCLPFDDASLFRIQGRPKKEKKLFNFADEPALYLIKLSLLYLPWFYFRYPRVEKSFLYFSGATFLQLDV